MDRSDTIDLIAVTYTQDDIGQRVPSETKRTVFCNVHSLQRNEWYDAARTALQAVWVVTMFLWDYNEEPLAEYRGVRYAIYRTFEVQGRSDLLELYLERKAGV